MLLSIYPFPYHLTLTLAFQNQQYHLWNPFINICYIIAASNALVINCGGGLIILDPSRLFGISRQIKTIAYPKTWNSKTLSNHEITLSKSFPILSY
jgi:hypothetical protein